LLCVSNAFFRFIERLRKNGVSEGGKCEGVTKNEVKIYELAKEGI
jgi:hypothetical protein